MMNTEIIKELEKVIRERKDNPNENSYVSSVINNQNRLLEKIGEESTETIIAAKDEENIVHETADLLFHLMILTNSFNISFDEVLKELEKRRN